MAAPRAAGGRAEAPHRTAPVRSLVFVRFGRHGTAGTRGGEGRGVRGSLQVTVRDWPCTVPSGRASWMDLVGVVCGVGALAVPCRLIRFPTDEKRRRARPSLVLVRESCCYVRNQLTGHKTENAHTDYFQPDQQMLWLQPASASYTRSRSAGDQGQRVLSHDREHASEDSSVVA